MFDRGDRVKKCVNSGLSDIIKMFLILSTLDLKILNFSAEKKL